MLKDLRKLSQNRAFRTALLPLLLLLMLATATFLIFQYLSDSENLELKTATQITTEQAGKRLESWVTVRTHALWQVMDRVPPFNGGKTQPFIAGATTIVKRHGGLLALNWIDKDFVISIVVPREGNEAALGQCLLNHPDPGVRLALERVQATRAFCATQPVELFQGGTGIATYLPVYNERGDFLGMINGVFRIKEMVNAALPEPELRTRYRLALADSEGRIRVNLGHLDPHHSTLFTSSYPIQLFDQDWDLIMEPYPRFIEEYKGRGEIFFLILGLLFSTAIAGFVYALLVRQELLKQKESRYRSLFERSRDAIYLSRLDGSFIDANQACLDLFGYSREEMMMTHTQQLYQHAADRKKLLIELTDLGYVQDFPVQLIRKDGKSISCLITASLFHDTSGGIEGIQGIIRDITDKLELEEKFHQAQKMEAMGRLAGGIAHDFNNLLTAQFGQVELARSALASNAPALPYIQDIQDTAERAAELTRRLLAFSRKQRVRPRLIDLNEVVRGAENLLKRLIGEDIHLVMDLGTVPGRINVDPVQIEQVLINLAVNARDAMVDGGELSIKTSSVVPTAVSDNGDKGIPELGVIRLVVSDNGSGIPKEVLPHIYEPYFTTKPEMKGTGLGLATVFGIMDQIGGKITVESEMGKGTTFTLEFPISNRDTAMLQDGGRYGEPFKGRGVILVVEDDEAVRVTTQELLRNLGYVVEVASTPEEGLRLFSARNGEVNLVLSDVIMPGMSGPEMVGEIRKHAPGTRVLYMSGHTPQEFHRRGLLGPEDEILQKPFTIRELAEKIHEKMS